MLGTFDCVDLEAWFSVVQGTVDWILRIIILVLYKHVISRQLVLTDGQQSDPLRVPVSH